MLVSVVVVNWNRVDLLRECLISLQNQTYKEIEIIVVDNGSIDGSPYMVMREFPDVHLLALNFNSGFAPANNIGAYHAKGEWIAFLNNDAVADKDWITNLVENTHHFPPDGPHAVFASRVLKYGTEELDSAGITLYPDGTSKGRTNLEAKMIGASGCALFIRTDAWEEIGGFDDRFYAYCEDTDLALRLRKSGYKCEYVPNAKVYHRYSSTAGAYSPRKIFFVERNRVFVMLKHFPLWLIALSPIFTLWRGLHHLRSNEFVSARKEYPWYKLVVAALAGYVDALVNSREIWRDRKAKGFSLRWFSGVKEVTR